MPLKKATLSFFWFFTFFGGFIISRVFLFTNFSVHIQWFIILQNDKIKNIFTKEDNIFEVVTFIPSTYEFGEVIDAKKAQPKGDE